MITVNDSIQKTMITSTSDFFSPGVSRLIYTLYNFLSSFTQHLFGFTILMQMFASAIFSSNT
jgi:hypothetical protein